MQFNVLVALKDLILGTEAIPEDASDRRTLYANLFPTLSVRELADLACIPRRQIERYRNSSRLSRQEILEARFPMTLARLQGRWREAFPSEFRIEALLDRLHCFRPWRSPFSSDLAQTFGEFVRYPESGFVARWPEIGCLSLLESLSVSLRSPKSGEFSNAHDLDEKSIEDVYCVEVMERSKYCLAPGVVFQEFQFDVVGALLWFCEMGRLPYNIDRGPIFAVGSRNSSGFSRWLRVPKQLFATLQCSSRNEFSSIAQATKEIETRGDGASSTAMFFYQLHLFGAIRLQRGGVN